MSAISDQLALITRPRFPMRASVRRAAALTRELAVTQFKLKYTGSVLGYVWSLVKPAMIFGVNYAVFAALLGAGASTLNFPLQLLFGIVLWTFFAETVGSAMSAVVSSGHVIRKAYFPRSVLVVAASVTASFTFVINMTLVVVVATAAGRLDIHWHSLLVIPLVIELYVLILGLSMILASFFVFYRDLGHIWEISSQVLFYGSAIVYPLSVIQAKMPRLQTLLLMNPVAQVIEDVRHAIVAADPRVPWVVDVMGWRYAIPLSSSVGLFVLGMLVFRAFSPSFAENL